MQRNAAVAITSRMNWQEGKLVHAKGGQPTMRSKVPRCPTTPSVLGKTRSAVASSLSEILDALTSKIECQAALSSTPFLCHVGTQAFLFIKNCPESTLEMVLRTTRLQRKAYVDGPLDLRWRRYWPMEDGHPARRWLAFHVICAELALRQSRIVDR